MEIWANTYPSRLESISTKTTKLQKKIVRAISFSDPRDHTRPIFENLSIILQIDDLNNEAIALIFSFKFFTKALPITFKDFFKSNNYFHNHKTTSFPYSSKTQNHLIFLRKGFKNIMIYWSNIIIPKIALICNYLIETSTAIHMLLMC